MSTSSSIKTDVTIAGGGLAGLTLAQQLVSARPDLNITVVEKSRFPVPEAVAKVGESTVEIGAHYLRNTVGLGEHLDQQHLVKFGLRFFLGSDTTRFDQLDEIGVSKHFSIPTHQIDRGRIENHLARQVTAAGVKILDGATTRQVDVSSPTKSLVADTDSGSVQLNSRWLVDAAGRQALIRNHLDLNRPSEHKGNAMWCRIDRTIKLDEWSTNQEWQQRCSPEGNRWLSTNHLMGPGYWVWIIPLASGITSIGIVCDDQALADNGISKAEDVLPWLAIHQPWLAEAMAGAKFLDFHLVRDYAFDCRQVFSDTGWGLVGEAGVFSDPFYSPGSDFIGIGNSMISQLIASAAEGHDIRVRSASYQKIYSSVFATTTSVYTRNYGGFGDRRMMGLKLLWDYAYYWGVLTLLFFHEALWDVSMMQKLAPLLLRAEQAHKNIQQLFRERASQRLVLPAEGRFLDQTRIPCLCYFNDILKQSESMADTMDLPAQMNHNVDMLERIAGHVTTLLAGNTRSKFTDDEKQLFGDYRQVILD